MSSDSCKQSIECQSVNIHLEVQGQQTTVTLEVQPGQRPIVDVLPAARRLTEQIADTSAKTAAREGRQISCRAGCGACCRQLVVISPIEALSLADLVAAMPAERQADIRRRFEKAQARLEASGLLEPKQPDRDRYLIQPVAEGKSAAAPLAQRYFQQRIACPFLEEESCGIYPNWPLVCREYLVTSPAEQCARLFETPVDRVELPVHMGSVMVRFGHRVGGAPYEAIPLVLALEWAAAHRGEFEKLHDGLDLVAELVRETATKQDGQMTNDNR